PSPICHSAWRQWGALMAITGSIALSSATAKQEQTVTATLTITNSGGSPINVNSVQPLLTPNGLNSQPYAAAVGIPQVGGAFPSSVPGSNGTLLLTWGITPHAPTNTTLGANSGSFVYTVGAIILTNDGSITTASTSN